MKALYVVFSATLFVLVFGTLGAFDASAETPTPPTQMNELDAARFYAAQQRIQVIQLSANLQIGEQQARLVEICKKYKFTFDDLSSGAVSVSPEGAITYTKKTPPTKK